MLYTIRKAITLAVLSSWVIASNGNLIWPRESDDGSGLQLFHASDLAPRAGGGGRGGKNEHPEGENAPKSPDGTQGGNAGEQTGDEGGFGNADDGETEGGFTKACSKKRRWPGTLFWRRGGCASDKPGEEQGTPSDKSEDELLEVSIGPPPKQMSKEDLDKLYDTSLNRGRSAMNRLETVLGQGSPPSSQIPSVERMNSKYRVDDKKGTKEAEVLDKLGNYKDSDNWVNVEILNREENVDKFVQNKFQEIRSDLGLTGVDKAQKETGLEVKAAFLKIQPMLQVGANIQSKVIVLPASWNRKYDLNRKFDDPEDYLLQRPGLDNEGSVKFTDQVMYSWELASQRAGKNVKEVELEYVVRETITTPNTQRVIEMAMEKANKRYEDSPNGIVEFEKGQEGFEAIMGTIHGERIAQMLTDYPDVLGRRTISKLILYQHKSGRKEVDMVLFIEKTPGNA